jgi:hypothetical protein
VTSTRSLFDTFAKGLAEHLSGYGFDHDKGARAFRRYSADGDILLVELQSSKGSTRTAKAFYINVALVLAPKWEMDRRRLGLPASELPRSAHGSWFRRIGSATLPGDDEWTLADRASLVTVSAEVRRRIDETLPDLLHNLDRDTLFVDAAERFQGGAWRVRAWLLAANGPSEELERLLSTRDPGTARTIREYSELRGDHTRRATDAEQAVQGRVAEEDVVQLLKRLSGYICYAYDDHDEGALTGALDHTNDESADAWFRYPLMGIPPLTVHLARSPGSTVVSVRVQGTMKQILAARTAALLNPLQR